MEKSKRIGQHDDVGLLNLLRGVALMLEIDIECGIDRHRLDEASAYRRPGWRHGLAKDVSRLRLSPRSSSEAAALV